MMDEKLYLRIANENDVDILYKWVNDKVTRQNAFDSHIITYEEHTAWFNRILQDDDQIQFILMYEDKPIGQIRLTVDNQNAEIDYSISESERGNGYGADIIRLTLNIVKEKYPKIKKLIGRVKTSNEASYRCFLKNGFNETYRNLEFFI